ncbi:MAG: ABC transporter substrate-binding protein [Pseudomonadota bacterium]
MTASGLTWDHPRGRDALREIARRTNDTRTEPLIEWHLQPLEGFESAPIADLAARHDILVLDHPHIGEAIAAECLQPLEDFYAAEQIARWEAQSVGAALSSYVWEGKTWALPLDVASQVMVRRSQAIAGAPTQWSEIEELAQTHPVALSLAGPHAILTIFSLAAGQNHLARGNDMLPDEAFSDAFERARTLWQRRPKGSETLNPIALLEAMTRGEIALCPLIFGYVNYAAPGPNQLAFSAPAAPFPGGVLGGTGLAFTKGAAPSEELLAHIASLLDETTQTDLIPAFGGQSSARAAWENTQVNAAWGNFYADTLPSVERAFVRPRFDGYIAFQTAASEAVRSALAGNAPPETALSAIRSLWHDARRRAHGPLDDERSLS